MPPSSAAFFISLVRILALLISYTAGSLASRLARGLALAAAAVLSGLAKVLCIKCLNTLHNYNPPLKVFYYVSLYHVFFDKSI